ncbi:MAG TPA: IclR family transcriptional regulator [Acetobacteraceae bacterium]|jgi:IclR family transcriptional regulator, acetate operon repressor|nr:IclR family transcriptional regulator [Acetobacteraceae bacterium]
MSHQDPVKTAVRTLDVFEVFAAVKGPLTLTELAARLGSPVSSCHALVRTLQLRGYVYILDERKRVYPTKRLLMMAQQIAQNDPVLERIGPVLATLQADTGETVILGKRQGNAVTYLEVMESRQTIRYAANPGDVKPLHSSAIGKAMLGVLTDTELARLVRKLSLPAITESTIKDANDLIRDIQQGRARDFFVTRGENVPDVMAIAIVRTVGEEPYGVAVAGPMARIEARSTAIFAALRKAGDTLQRIDAELRG